MENMKLANRYRRLRKATADRGKASPAQPTAQQQKRAAFKRKAK